jgi:hypothetical protein
LRMKIEFQLLNCFWLIIPLLAWNLVLGPRITDLRVTSDAHSPKSLLIAENLTRIFVFALPVLLPLQWDNAWSKIGWGIYLVGTLVYFASWLPLLLADKSTWSSKGAGLLAPHLTPFLSFLGITLIAQAWPYGLLSAAFIGFHTWHGIQNL